MIFMLGFITAPAYRSEIFGPKEKIAENLTDILNGMVYDSTFLLIIVSCILALVLGQEFSWRTVQQEIAAGHSRLTVFISKIIVYLTAFNLLALVFPAAGCIRESIYFGIHDLIGFLSDFVRAAADSNLFVFCSEKYAQGNLYRRSPHLCVKSVSGIRNDAEPAGPLSAFLPDPSSDQRYRNTYLRESCCFAVLEYRSSPGILENIQKL